MGGGSAYVGLRLVLRRREKLSRAKEVKKLFEEKYARPHVANHEPARRRACSTLKANLRHRYNTSLKTGKNRWFFQKLRF